MPIGNANPCYDGYMDWSDLFYWLLSPFAGFGLGIAVCRYMTYRSKHALDK